jgi:hypothetical protein
MTKWGWFSADEEGNVVGKTEVDSEGRVHQYPYTTPDNVKDGHGHTIYESMDDFIKENPSWSRDKDSDDSKDRGWKGNGYILLSLKNLTFYELQLLEAKTKNDYLKKSARSLINNYYNDFSEFQDSDIKKILKRR